MNKSDISLTIDNKKIRVKKDLPVLEAARINGIDIPSLCADPRLEPQDKCGICAVEIKNMDGLQLACMTKAADGMEVITKSLKIRKLRKGILSEFLSDHNAYCEPPCSYSCPAGIDIPGYITAIARGDDKESIRIVKERLPLPRIIGRICTRPCQKACRRQNVDAEPVAICQLKRFAGDNVAGNPVDEPVAAQSGKKIAIIGSGPSGLTAAYYLAKAGHKVTIFEAGEKPGGMLRTTIPSFRLPKDVLDEEIKEVLNLGVELMTNIRLGRDMSIDDLRGEHDAVYLAIGAQRGSFGGIDGSNGDDFFTAVDFLAKYNAGEWDWELTKVVVIGGGFTAIDAARAASRLGATETIIVYRRTKKEMPASVNEVIEAEEEGIRFHYLAAPVSIDNKGGKITEVIFQEMELGEPDESGRRRPVAIEDSEFSLEASTVILGLGQEVDTDGFDKILGRNSKGTIKVDDLTLETNIKGVFAGGDAVTGPSTVVESIAMGRRASIVIDAFLGKRNVRQACHDPMTGLERQKPEFFEIAVEPVSKIEKQSMPELSVFQRSTSKEVELGYTEKQARDEASRCLDCICHAASVCKLQGLSIRYRAGATKFTGRQGQYEAFKGRSFFELDRKRCIKCHNCVRICDEVQSLKVYTVDDKGYPALRRESYSESGCVFCGQCISACPTGALKDITDTGILRKDKRERVVTICPYCGVGCSLELEIEAGRIVAARNVLTSASANKGNLCVKGRFGYGFVNSFDRLSQPLIRKKGVLTPASWDEAIAVVAGKLKSVKDKHGSDSIAVLSSSKCTNEENYLLQKLTRAALGTNNIDNCARL